MTGPGPVWSLANERRLSELERAERLSEIEEAEFNELLALESISAPAAFDVEESAQ